jgi:hypothetical protein
LTASPRSHAATARDRHERIGHPVARLGIGAILIALGAVVIVLGRRQTTLDAFTAFALACCATLLVSPLSWGHYYMVELPALVCVPIWLYRHGRARAAKIAAIFPAIAAWTYYLAMPYAGALGILGAATTVWFLGASGLILSAELRITPKSLAAARSHRHASTPSRPHWRRLPRRRKHVPLDQAGR